jgi:hypothetical protein
VAGASLSHGDVILEAEHMGAGIGDGVMATNCEIALFAGTAGIAAPFQTPPVSNSFAADWNANGLRFDDVSEGHLNERVGTPSQQVRSRRATSISEIGRRALRRPVVSSGT